MESESSSRDARDREVSWLLTSSSLEARTGQARLRVAGGGNFKGQHFDSKPPKPNTRGKNHPLCPNNMALLNKMKFLHWNFTFSTILPKQSRMIESLSLYLYQQLGTTVFKDN